MREALRQLGLTLAFPVAVGVAWLVRAEPAANPVPESATAYRVELAELPLPTPERLRPPGEATPWRGNRAIPEEPGARNRRAALPIAPAMPVDLAVEEESEREIAASSSPRSTAVDPSHAAIPEPHSAPPDVAALIAVAPWSASHRPRSVEANAASTAPETPAQGTSELAAAKRAVHSQATKPVATEPGTLVLASALKAARIASPEPAPALPRPDSKPIPSRGPVHLPDYAKGHPNPTPIVLGRAGHEESPLGKLQKTDYPASPTRPGPTTHEPFDVSLYARPFELSVQPKDFPRLPFEDDAAPTIAVHQAEFSSPTPAIPWFSSRPTTVLMIPEPGSAVLIGVALAVLGAARRRRA